MNSSLIRGFKEDHASEALEPSDQSSLGSGCGRPAVGRRCSWRADHAQARRRLPVHTSTKSRSSGCGEPGQVPCSVQTPPPGEVAVYSNFPSFPQRKRAAAPRSIAGRSEAFKRQTRNSGWLGNFRPARESSAWKRPDSIFPLGSTPAPQVTLARRIFSFGGAAARSGSPRRKRRRRMSRCYRQPLPRSTDGLVILMDFALSSDDRGEKLIQCASIEFLPQPPSRSALPWWDPPRPRPRPACGSGW